VVRHLPYLVRREEVHVKKSIGKKPSSAGLSRGDAGVLYGVAVILGIAGVISAVRDLWPVTLGIGMLCLLIAWYLRRRYGK